MGGREGGSWNRAGRGAAPRKPILSPHFFYDAPGQDPVGYLVCFAGPFLLCGVHAAPIAQAVGLSPYVH